MRTAKCPECSTRFDVSQYEPGKKLRCGRCKAIMTVPAADSEGGEAPSGVSKPAATTASGSTAGPSTRSLRRSTEPPQSDEGGGSEAATAPRRGTSSVLRKGKTAAPPVSKSGTRRFPRGDTAPADKKSKKKLAIIIAAIALVVFGLVYAFRDENGAPVDPDAAARVQLRLEFSQREATVDRSDAEGLFSLYNWCCQRPDLFASDAEEVLRKALAAAPEHAGATAAMKSTYGQKLARAEKENSDTAWVALGEFCEKFGLKTECENAANHALELNKDNARAHELLGHVATTNELGETVWLTKEEIEDRDTVYRIGPREKFINNLSEKTYGEVFERVPLWEWRKRSKYREAECKEGWMLRDYEPYVIFLEKDAQIKEDMFEGVYDTLGKLSKVFFSAYLGEEEPKTMVEELMAVFIFKNRESFLRRTGAKEYVGAYFTGERQALMVPYARHSKERERLLFHEGAHQLVDFVARKGGGVPRPFWFEEGVSTNFEALCNIKSDVDPLIGIGSVHYLFTVKAAISTKKHRPFKEMIEMSYGEGQKSDDDRGNNYAQSWAMVHYLYNYENGKYREKWREYFKDMTSGKSGLSLFESHFGDATEREKEWEKFILSLGQ
ncbi:MAG: hypothetical protein RDV41_13510 [Planctomycetota bacterium]|nr:hypothetical protein [Planctomycetota bacterium]